MGFLQHLDFLDFLAPGVNMSVNGQPTVKTKPGAIMFLVASVAFVGTVIFSVMQLFNTSLPQINIETSSSATYPKINLSDGYLPPMILPLRGASVQIPYTEFSKFATLEANQIKVLMKTQPDGSLLLDYKSTPVSVVRCKELILAGKLDFKILTDSLGLLSKGFYENAFCLDVNSSTNFVKGKPTEEEYIFFNFQIYPCSLEDPAQCLPKDKVEELFIYFLTGQETLNFGNYEQPLSYSFNGDEFYYIDTAFSFSAVSKVMTEQIWDLKSFLQPESLRISYPKIETSSSTVKTRNPTQTTCTKEQIAEGDCVSYYTRLWKSGGTVTKITRTYKSVVSTLGDIGGARDTIFMIAMLL